MEELISYRIIPWVVRAIVDNAVDFCELAQEAEQINKEKGVLAGLHQENAKFFADTMTENLNLLRARKKLLPVKKEDLLVSTIRVMKAVHSDTKYSPEDMELAESFINWRVIPELPQGRPEWEDDD
jgi:hypothetical protein